MSARWRWWYTPLIFLALALAWTWPSALADGERMVGRHFDVPASLWFLGSSPRLLQSMTDPMTGWPDGVALGRLDSFTVLILGWLTQWVHPARLYGLAHILGVTATAWAAEAFAREVGARAPWSLLAGIAAGFCGLVSTALLEGYVYHAVIPWLPLCALYWWRSCQGGTARDGVMTGLMFSLTLLTTAYIGLAAVVVIVGFATATLAQRQLPLRAWGGALAVVVPVGALYLTVFLSGSGDVQGEETIWHLTAVGRSSNLLNMAGPTASQDSFFHSASATTSMVVLCLAMAAPVVLSRLSTDQERGAVLGWRTLAATGFVALLLSMGPTLGSPKLTLAPLPLMVMRYLPGHEFLRFPARLGWAWVVCGGALAAWTATAIAPRVGRPAYALLAFTLVDLFVVERLPTRQRLQIATSPSAYAAHEGAVLDLFPEELRRGYEFDAWAQARACYHQLSHRRPIANDCVVTRVELNPGWQKARALNTLLIAGDSEGAAALLQSWDFATVAWRPDFYTAGDRERVRATLSALDADPAVSTDGGEHVIAYRVP